MLTIEQFLKRFEAAKLAPNRYDYNFDQVSDSVDSSPYRRTDPDDGWTRWAYSTMNAILDDQSDRILLKCLENVHDTDIAYDFYIAALNYAPNYIRPIFKLSSYIYTTSRNYHAIKL